MKILYKLFCLLSVFFLLMTSPALAQATPTLAQPTRESLSTPTVPSTIKVLPREVSRSLKITKLPTSRPIPLIVGSYWSCREQSGFEICRFKVVACTSEQETCVETP